ncbi:hypothetical protein HAX54_036001, partial [Datura stramonium]|nr:hypothetical protein [Datura stramonium]
MRARIGGASFSLAPRVEGHVIGSTVSSESQTLITPPQATMAASPDPLSTTVSTDATVDVMGSLHLKHSCQNQEHRSSQ